MAVTIRSEKPGDREAVYAVNSAAFDTDAEADLVNSLRELARPLVSLLAEISGAVVGHIMFSPASLEEQPDLPVMGLAPMAVLPSHQSTGIGSKLVVIGLEHCRQLGIKAVIVLGHPDYYPRFGFQPASRFGIESDYEVPDEVFMAMELEAGALNGVNGRVSYHEAFKNF